MEDSVAVGSPCWVSQWASLAANQTRTDPEGSGAEPPPFVHQERGNLVKCLYPISKNTAKLKKSVILPNNLYGIDQ